MFDFFIHINLSHYFPGFKNFLRSGNRLDLIKTFFQQIQPDDLPFLFSVRIINYGGSPRASINLALASKAYAFLKRRGYENPEEVRSVCHDVLRHRIGLTYEAEAENVTQEDIINQILNTVEVP